MTPTLIAITDLIDRLSIKVRVRLLGAFSPTLHFIAHLLISYCSLVKKDGCEYAHSLLKKKVRANRTFTKQTSPIDWLI